MNNAALVTILKEHAFFRGMPEAQLEILAECASPVAFKAREVIFKQNENADHFYAITEGRVSVDIVTTAQVLRIQTVEKDDVLGWSWFFPPHIWHFDAIALEPTRAIAMDARCLRGKCEGDVTLGYELLKRFSAIIIRRLEAARFQMLDMFGSPPRG